jgi:predicted enzyme related to lactoylglutathione lyase
MANMFVHVELSTDDAEKAVGFYKQLFKWKIAPVKGMPYFMLDTGSKEGGGGIQNKPMPEMPSMWTPYVEVDSVKTTIDKARSLGATIHVEYQPIPGMGAMGIFSDPSGASLGVWEAEKKPAAKKPAKKAAKKPAKKKGKK